jgi:hypothetical protein
MKHALIAAAIALSACATPYSGPGVGDTLMGGFAGGVKAEPLAPDYYRISAKLNAFSTPEMVQDYLLLRAADEATAQGAIGFVIEGTADASKAFSVTTPGTATTYGSAYSTGNYAYGSATTTYSPGQTSYGVKPGGIMMIRLVREPVPEGVRYIKAADIEATVGARIKRKP